mmetsp:Transcript_26638/g.53522  ORF Transcript_26638/g.53522 Transcript_26638/m.53522 type:complete len:120 (-) Transcript_26638:250-609(-)
MAVVLVVVSLKPGGMRAAEEGCFGFMIGEILSMLAALSGTMSFSRAGAGVPVGQEALKEVPTPTCLSGMVMVLPKVLQALGGSQNSIGQRGEAKSPAAGLRVAGLMPGLLPQVAATVAA